MDDVSRELFVAYKDLLLKWNKSINLISKQSEVFIWQRHILDSFQLADFVDDSDYIVDIGSGGGFPGVVLSLSGVKNVALIESDSRKIAFLRQAAALSVNKVSVLEQKLAPGDFYKCDVVTCRGVAKIKDILLLTKGFKVKKKHLLLKGEGCEAEIEEAKKDWLFSFKLHDSMTSNKGKIVEITNVRKNNINC